MTGSASETRSRSGGSSAVARSGGQAKPSPSGAYTIRFNAPTSRDFASTGRASVLAKAGSKRYVKQFARGTAIKLGGATG